MQNLKRSRSSQQQYQAWNCPSKSMQVLVDGCSSPNDVFLPPTNDSYYASVFLSPFFVFVTVSGGSPGEKHPFRKLAISEPNGTTCSVDRSNYRLRKGDEGFGFPHYLFRNGFVVTCVSMSLQYARLKI
ncbi:hypothetical protein TNIN_123751 [Trichonephila inaurata madagascariensis]|uniref:Uncharacterized protein n=1 Tax=Trichonephila inaurata madagascariensis TaxID=2747483 RepID=A0A8X6WLV7_9ARAC|nr:hypothetical protein TNIN_123751 [Trichonephila inaurata madagascariensis]